MLRIEMLNICNYKCYFCNSKNVTEHKILGAEEFLRIINDAKDIGIKLLDLTPSEGELFLDKNFLFKLETSLKDFDVRIITNFSLCTPKIQDKLKNIKNNSSNKLEIVVSDYGGGDKELFKAQTRQSDRVWEQYRNNLDYSSKIGLDVLLGPRGHNYTFYSDFPVDKNSEHRERKRAVFYKANRGICKYQHTPRLAINGDLFYCLCREDDYPGTSDLYIGNIHERSLKDLYFNRHRLDIFTNQSNGMYNKTCLNCELFCNEKINSIRIYKHLASMKEHNSPRNRSSSQ